MDAIFTDYDSDKSGALEFNEFKRLMMNKLSYKVGAHLLLLCLCSVAINLLHSSAVEHAHISQWERQTATSVRLPTVTVP